MGVICIRAGIGLLVKNTNKGEKSIDIDFSLPTFGAVTNFARGLRKVEIIDDIISTVKSISGFNIGHTLTDEIEKLLPKQQPTLMQGTRIDTIWIGKKSMIIGDTMYQLNTGNKIDLKTKSYVK